MPAKPELGYTPAYAEKTLAKIGTFCRSLPDVTERISHGAPTWFIKTKASFATFTDNHHHDGRLALVTCAPPGVQAMLVDSDPDLYFIPPYVGHMGWVGMRLDHKPPWKQVAALLEQAHTTRATKRR